MCLLARSADTPDRATPQKSCVGDEEIGRRVSRKTIESYTASRRSSKPLRTRSRTTARSCKTIREASRCRPTGGRLSRYRRSSWTVGKALHGCATRIGRSRTSCRTRSTARSKGRRIWRRRRRTLRRWWSSSKVRTKRFHESRSHNHSVHIT
jgi:hypothetical protein